MSIRAGLIAAVLAAPEGAQAVAREWAWAAVICVGVAVLAEVALKVVVILYVLRDAPKRGMDPTVWVVVAVFAEVIALIVYLCVRQPLRSHSHDTRD